MRSRPSKGNNQMSDAATAVSEAASKSAPAPPLAAAGVRRDTRRGTTGLRGGVPDREGPLVSTHRGVAKCANYRGPHFSQANACLKKKAARGDAKGWRSPSPKWRQKGETLRPEYPPTTAEGKTANEVEGNEIRHESNS